MRRYSFAGAGLLAVTLAGCGTVQNLAGGYKDRGTVPYGGVRHAADKFRDPYDVEMAYVLYLGPLWVGDIAASAVGDTLTLPYSLAAAAVRGFNDYYFPPDKPVDPAWRQFRFGDPPAEPVSPPASSPSTPAPSPATRSAGR